MESKAVAHTSDVEEKKDGGFKVSRNLEQLLCFLYGPIFDGNLISKSARDDLHLSGLIFRADGHQSLTALGLQYLKDLGYLKQ